MLRFSSCDSGTTCRPLCHPTCGALFQQNLSVKSHLWATINPPVLDIFSRYLWYHSDKGSPGRKAEEPDDCKILLDYYNNNKSLELLSLSHASCREGTSTLNCHGSK